MLKAVEGVKNWTEVERWFSGGLLFVSYSIKDDVERFLRGQGLYQPSWRMVIFALDEAGEIPLANRIRGYGEPVQGLLLYVYRGLQVG